MMNAQAYYETAPWTQIALMKLHDLEHGKGARFRTAVDPEAAMYARTVLTSLRHEELPIPGVCSVEGGSVLLVWTVGLKQIEAILAPDKSGTFVVTDADRIVDDGEIKSREISGLSHALGDMIAV